MSAQISCFLKFFRPSDGTTVFYNILTLASAPELGVLNFDGTSRLVLLDASTLPRLLPSSGDRVQLSSDGSLLLLGSRGVLLNTDGSGMLQLATQTPGTSAIDGLLSSETFHATMNGSATRFLYVARPFFAQPLQLATLEINPTSLGDAPSITNPTIDPPFVLTRGRSASTVSATSELLRVGN